MAIEKMELEARCEMDYQHITKNQKGTRKEWKFSTWASLPDLNVFTNWKIKKGMLIVEEHGHLYRYHIADVHFPKF